MVLKRTIRIERPRYKYLLKYVYTSKDLLKLLKINPITLFKGFLIRLNCTWFDG